MSAVSPLNDDIRAWLAIARFASLGTLLDGTPFVSLVPYALDEGAPVLWLSDLAVHTKCLANDARCSLLVHDPAVDPAADAQSSWRVTLVGRAVRATEERARAAFFARHPAVGGHGGADPSALPGFAAWRIDVEKARFIAGFGRMGWV